MKMPFSKGDRVEVSVRSASDLHRVTRLVRGMVVECYTHDSNGYEDRCVDVACDDGETRCPPWWWVRKLSVLELVAEAAR